MLCLANAEGKIRSCPTGFSWTTLFFGPLVPMARGWFPMIPVYLGGAFLTFGFFAFVMPFQINRYWISYLLDRGFTPATKEDSLALAAMGLPDVEMPKWAASRLKTVMAGDKAEFGLYVALNGFDYRFVGDEEVPFDGVPKTEYIRLPMLVTLALLPILGAVFYFSFPLIVIGFSLYAFFKLGVKAVGALIERKAHWAHMNWDPIMAYMKRPGKKKESDRKSEK